MERELLKEQAKQENLTDQLGKTVPLSDSAVSTGWTKASSLGLGQLISLKNNYLDCTPVTSSSPKIPRSLSFEQLEMLEAELNNQGILSRSQKNEYSLTKHLSFQADVWRWRAERFGVSGQQLKFRVSLNRYLIFRAEELLKDINQPELAPTDSLNLKPYRGSWSHRFESPGGAIDELRYLDSLAAYLNGAYDKPKNGYQRGLNLVLKVICCKQEEPDSGGPDKLTIELPISKQDFFRKLRQLR